MRTMALCITLFCALAGNPQIAESQKTFIGTIHYDVVNKGKHIELTAATDGQRLRQDVLPRDSIASAYPFAMILDYPSRDVIWLMPLTHRYSRRHLDGADSGARASGGRGESAGNARPQAMRGFAATGRREHVAGVECELYTMETGSTPDEYCLTMKLGGVLVVDSLLRQSSLSAGGMAPAEQLFPPGAIVLRMRWNSADPPVTMTATTIDRTAPSPTLFTVPAGYELIPY